MTDKNDPTELDKPMMPEEQETKAFEPSGLIPLIEALLKHPNSVAATIQRRSGRGLTLPLVLLIATAYGCYGLIVGGFTGGVQWWASPAKIVIGVLLSGMICLPSLFIFSCLSGASVGIKQVKVLMLLQLGLSAVLLVGFLPVAWIFSQSTESTFFIGMLHVSFWMIGLTFGTKLLWLALVSLGANQTGYVTTWSLIFILTLLQMTTAMRPIIGSSDTLLPTEKKFFVQYWADAATAEFKGGGPS